jgi:hypothetical protein
MKELEKALKEKKLEDLKKVKTDSGSNLLEPTQAEIESILTALKDGKSYKEIKKEVRREVGVGKQGFSYGQIKEIDMAREAKVTELTPKDD